MSDLDPHFERKLASVRTLPELDGFEKGIIYLTPDYSSGSYLLMQRAIPP